MMRSSIGCSLRRLRTDSHRRLPPLTRVSRGASSSARAGGEYVPMTAYFFEGNRQATL